MNTKRILVAGGSGFVGSNLLQYLLREGCDVIATVHNSLPKISGAEYITADLTKANDCEKVVRGVDCVILCAGRSSGASATENRPLDYVTPGVIMNALMLDAAHRAGVKQFVFISSSIVYPPGSDSMSEDDVTGEMFDKYFCLGWVQRFAEIMCQMYSSKISTPMSTVIIRAASLYGEYDNFDRETSRVIPALIRKFVENHDSVEVWGDGTDLRDFLHVEDFVRGVKMAMEQNVEVMNIASGETHSVADVIDVLVNISHSSSKIRYNNTKPQMIPVRKMNILRAERELGFAPKISLEDGIKRTYEWYKNVYGEGT